MIKTISLFALAMFSSGALAQSQSWPSADDFYASQGFKRVDDGLYAQQTSSGESYVAINDNGRVALVAKIQETRATLAARYGAKSLSVAQQTMLQNLDDWANRFNQPEPKSTVSGDCTGSGGTGYPQLYATASSSGGTSASGYSVRNLDFGPGTPTTNTAYASTDNTYQSTSTASGTPASVSTSEPRSCDAASAASVTCYGHANPSITAFASSHKASGPCTM